MRQSRSFSILFRLAALVSLLLLLIPSAAFALPLEGAAPTAAVSAPSPLSQEACPADAYLSASRALAGLGLSRGQADQVWSRMGASVTDQLASGQLTNRELEYLALPFCRQDRLDRYLAYAQANPGLNAEEVAVLVNIGLDRPLYSDIRTLETPSGTDLLVNKYYALPQEYVPEDLVQLDGLGTGALSAPAAQAFGEMVQAAREDGISLRSVSAYRSYATQSTLYKRYVAQSGQALADTFSARPGHSEHQTGLALDINVAQTSAHFENTPAYAWLVDHCAQYGFLLRYPQGKESITGYRFEPWHYRYVGTEIARICMEQGLTYEEYVARQPVPGDNQAPALTWQGQPLELERGALMLDGVPYLPVSSLAQALDWSVQYTGRCLTLTGNGHTLTLSPSWYGLWDGTAVHLSAPAVSIEGTLYLSLGDLCTAMDLEASWTGAAVDLSLPPVPAPTPSFI